MPEQCEAREIIICSGPPDCPFEGDAAVQNQLDGCPLCRRILIGQDGSETEYRLKAN